MFPMWRLPIFSLHETGVVIFLFFDVGSKFDVYKHEYCTVIQKHEMNDNFRILKIQETFCKSVRFYKAVLAFHCITSPHIVEGCFFSIL